MRKNSRKPSPHNLIRTLSKLGVCSRKQALAYVQDGRVSVNKTVVTDPGRAVRPHDKISLDGKPAEAKSKRYFLFHKPAGCVTTRKDEKGRKTIYDWLGDLGDWAFPVGRLDQDSEGLLILTNDTAFGHRLTEPAFQVSRTYEVWIQGRLTQADRGEITHGMDIGRGEHTRPARLKVLKEDLPVSHLEITLTEGKNRAVRRMFESLGKPLTRLLRTRFGVFSLGTLCPGAWKEIPPPR